MIGEHINKIIDEYKTGNAEVGNGISFSMYDTINRIDYILNSKYQSGGKDEYGFDKPYYNITLSAVNVGVRATDFDTKDIQVQALEPEFEIHSLLERKELENWMEDISFDITLNDIGETRVKYGSSLCKKVIKNGQIYVEVVPWGNVFVNQSNIIDNPIVEVHYMNQLELSKKRDVWDGLDANYMEIMDLFKNLVNKKNKEEIKNRIEVYEITGELPKEYIYDNVEPYEYSYQKHFVIIDGEKEYVLYSEEINTKDGSLENRNYAILDWDTVTKRGLGLGMVEIGFEAQRWVNDNIIKENQLMAYASKLLIKSSQKLPFENIITEAKNGTIIPLVDGDLTRLDLTPSSLPEFANNISSWKDQFVNASSTFPGITGEQQPSNTPLGSVQLQNAEARSIFDYRKEKMGIFIEDIINAWVIPHLMKKMNRKHILAGNYSREQLDIIDMAFAYSKANEKVGEILDKEDALPFDIDYESLVNEAMEELKKNGDRRYIDIPESFFKNVKSKVRVITTNEKQNKQVILQSLTQLMTFLPTLREQPEAMPIFSKIIEIAGVGISPREILPKVQAGVPAKENVTPQQADKFGKAISQEK